MHRRSAVTYSRTFDNEPVRYKAKIAEDEGGTSDAWNGKFQVDGHWGVQSFRVTIAPGGGRLA